MSNIAGDVKKLFNYKYKKRDDTITDQYNRIFMTKVMVISAFITGLQWYSDEIKCIVPSISNKAVKPFSGRSCWINGFYIYDELRAKVNFEGYYGIPNDMKHNGSDGGSTCVATDGNTLCQPMTKIFYLQYQWFPFYLATLALFYYLPYLFFGIANIDLKNLKDEIKKQDPDLDGIIRNYFERANNTPGQQKVKIALNIIIKIGYIFANLLVFLITDNILNGDFIKYGLNWMTWSEMENEPQHNYVGTREFLKAGEILLPTFGFCDVLEAGIDIKHSLFNEHKFVCEISQHILYQYVLMALWFLIIIGIILSIIGLIAMIIGFCVRHLYFAKEEVAAKAVSKYLTIREAEYVAFIRKKNDMLYGKLIRKLHEKFCGKNPPPSSPVMDSKPGYEETST